MSDKVSIPVPPGSPLRERLTQARMRRAVGGKIPSEAAIARAFVEEGLEREEKGAADADGQRAEGVAR